MTVDDNLVLVSVFSDEIVGPADQKDENGWPDQAWNSESKLDRREKSANNVFVL